MTTLPVGALFGPRPTGRAVRLREAHMLYAASWDMDSKPFWTLGSGVNPTAVCITW